MGKLKFLKLILIGFTLLQSFSIYAQQHFFVNYNTGEKLVQSQVIALTQNANNELLLGTFGGISIFNGNQFTTINKKHGLPNNFITCLFKDSKNNIWIATNSGLCKYDGKNIETINLIDKSNLTSITQIAEDANNNIWVLNSERIYKYNGTTFKQFLPEENTINNIATDKNGSIWVSTLSGYIFSIQNGKLQNKVSININNPIIKISKSNATNELLFISLSQILKVSEDNNKLLPSDFTLPSNKLTQAFLQDNKGNYWFAFQDGGLWLYENNNWTHYNHNNGLTSDPIVSFYQDNEHNIWIGSNGSGVYRFTPSPFTFYDKNKMLHSSVMMGITEANNKLYFSSINKGLYQLKDEQPQPVNYQLPQQINSIATYFDNSLLCASFGVGLWTWNGTKFRLIEASKQINTSGFTNLCTSDSSIWITTLDGLYLLTKKENITKILSKTNLLCALILNKDSVLLGNTDGAYIYSIKEGKLTDTPVVSGVIVLGMAQNNQYVFMASDDKGIIVWDKYKHTIQNINTQNGLSCDYVYSLLLDKNQNLWAGTGCGIDKIIFENKKISIVNYGIYSNLTDAESNANACYEDKDGNIWIANTKGLFKFDVTIQTEKVVAPKVIIHSVKLFSQDYHPKNTDSVLPFSKVIWNPVFSPGQNHLTFTFNAISLSGNKHIRYRYILEGADIAPTETELTTVVYPNLPAGEYVFKISSTDVLGNWQDNEIQYPFTIQSKYYQTNIFKFSLILLLIGLWFTLMFLRNRQKENRRKWEAQLREEEQAKVKQKTAEDFHDEIGNKLTRIHLLASVAASKSAPYSNEELNNVIGQIKNSATSLYKGSKDIIWSLQPFSDELLETINRIRENTAEMLENTGITLHYHQHFDPNYSLKKTVLPIDYSRNIIMIFKEAVNNSIKHSGAKNIYLSITVIRDKELIIEVKDDGKGFETTGDKGNGIGNMKRRADRINAALKLINKPDGTSIILEVMIRQT